MYIFEKCVKEYLPKMYFFIHLSYTCLIHKKRVYLIQEKHMPWLCVYQSNTVNDITWGPVKHSYWRCLWNSLMQLHKNGPKIDSPKIQPRTHPAQRLNIFDYAQECFPNPYIILTHRVLARDPSTCRLETLF